MYVNLRAPWQEAPPSESREPDSQQHYYFLKSRKDTALQISRARLPTGLLSQKSKRHRLPNLESQTPNSIITFSKVEEAPLSESQEPDSQQDCFLKNRRGIAL
ncbi:hypothetical protein ACFX1Q_022873 [Malus domestica]